MAIHSTFIESTQNHNEERVTQDHRLNSSGFCVQLRYCLCSLLPWMVTNVVWQHLFVVSIQIWCIKGNSLGVGLLRYSIYIVLTYFPAIKMFFSLGFLCFNLVTNVTKQRQ